MKLSVNLLTIPFVLFVSIGGFTACSKPTQDTAAAKNTADAKSDQQNQKAEKPALKSISLPVYWPQDIVLPKDAIIQTVTRKENAQVDVLDALMTGTMSERTEQLHQQFLADGWQANIVIPQQNNTLMDYEKAGRKITIELTQPSKKQVAMNLTYNSANSHNPKNAIQNQDKQKPKTS